MRALVRDDPSRPVVLEQAEHVERPRFEDRQRRLADRPGAVGSGTRVGHDGDGASGRKRCGCRPEVAAVAGDERNRLASGPCPQRSDRTRVDDGEGFALEGGAASQ